MRRRPAAALAVIVVVGSACAIQPDAQPRDIPLEDRLPLEPVVAEAGATAGSSRIYLVADDGAEGGERVLRPVSRSVNPPRPEAVLEELFRGPNEEEREAGFRTAIPDTLTLISARPAAGSLIVDVSREILELSGPALELAVAEIVFTATELASIDDVRLRVEGEQRAWPDGRGELQTDALTIYDFPGLVPSSQPALPAIPSEPVA